MRWQISAGRVRAALPIKSLSIALMAALCALLLALVAPSSALAVQVAQHSLTSSFNGSGSDAGEFDEVTQLGVDETTGDVYALDRRGEHSVIDKFNAAGVPAAFSSPNLSGTTSLGVPGYLSGSASLNVDNSTTATQGRIYYDNEDEPGFEAFLPSGDMVGSPFPVTHARFEDLAVERATGDIWIAGYLRYTEGGPVTQLTPDGEPTGREFLTATGNGGSPHRVALDSEGNIYIAKYDGEVDKYDAAGDFQYTLDSNENFDIAIDPVTNFVYLLQRKSGGNMQIQEYNSEGISLATWTVSGNAREAIAINGATGDIYVAQEEGTRSVGVYTPGAAITLPGPITKPASNFTPLGAQLNGTVIPEGVPTTNCHFEWGGDTSYGHTLPCSQGNVLNAAGTESVPVSASVAGLSKGTTYHYRLVASNANGTLEGRDATFIASEAPTVGGEFVNNVHADSAEFHVNVNPEGATTTFHVEYGTAECSAQPEACTSSPDISVGGEAVPQAQSQEVKGLEQGTTYHYRVIAANQNEIVDGAEHTFTTFPLASAQNDACENSHVRQQTGGALLLDCRAYELVSAANTGGYDVESNLVAGQEPYGGYPEADAPSRVLYGVHFGGIPGTDHPTNRGVDPYVATRGTTGWSTEYVGIPADNTFSLAPFSSTPSGADAGLDAFAFGGPNGCSPCFAGGYTGIPVRLPDGSLVQGMVAGVGVSAPSPSATPDGYIAKNLSANGEHFVFGSTALFALGGNDESGDVSIYDRNLRTGETKVVSNSPEGEDFPEPLPCLQGTGKCDSAEGDGNGIAELDISSDGSRILLGQKVSTDSDGNVYWHLYMNSGDATKTVALTPGASKGVLFDGMTSDGSTVYFSSEEPLTGEDTQHTGADIYAWSEHGQETDDPLSLLSRGDDAGNPGEPGNTGSCTPDNGWNEVSGTPSCAAVAIGGGGGVAVASGALYFLSPELLAGPSHGTEGEPNLFVAQPGGAPEFVATIDSSQGKTPPPPNHPAVRKFGSFTKPSFVGVDRSGGPSDGDIYVADVGTDTVQKFDPGGNLITTWGSGGTLSAPFTTIAGLAVDDSGNLDVLSSEQERVFQFSPSGASIGAFVVQGNGSIRPRGLAVDKEGDFYTIDGYAGHVEKFASTGGSLGEITPNLNYEAFGVGVEPFSNTLYVLGEEGTVKRYVFGENPSQVIEPGAANCTIAQYSGTGCKATSLFAENVPGVTSIAFDTAAHYVYVNQGNKIVQFDSAGNRLETNFSGAAITGSTSIAVDSSGDIFAPNTGGSHPELVEYGVQAAPFLPIDNPAVVDAIDEAGTRHSGDFQVTPSGQFAVYPTTLPLSGYDSAGHTEIFRFDRGADENVCVSCTPTGARATGDASLAPQGLSLTDDGKVFFNSTDPLAPRDLDALEDAYEWEPQGAGPQKAICGEESLSFDKVSGGCLGLISTGTSPFSSRLLGVSSDGRDAYFFTRDTLVPQDENGHLVKIYDAREEGGFPYVEPEVPCKASDECHGAGSAAPGPSGINTIRGRGGNAVGAVHCKKGFVAKQGKCVKKRKPRHHGHRGRGTHRHHGGRK